MLCFILSAIICPDLLTILLLFPIVLLLISPPFYVDDFQSGDLGSLVGVDRVQPQ